MRYSKKHKKEKKEKTRLWRSRLGEDPTRKKRYIRSSSLKQRYGISIEQYEKMVEEQNNLCYICKKDNFGKPLVVDHNHSTGKVRNLLCRGCNLGLGNANENILILRNMIKYLKKHANRTRL